MGAAPQPFKSRRMTLGSSDVPTILGLPRPTAKEPDSPWKVWARAKGLRLGTSNNSTRRGQIIEPALRAWYCAEYAPGQDVRLGPPITQAPMYGPEPWMSARPDMIVPGVRVIEIKTTRSFDEADGWGPDESDQAPASVIAQTTWQMIVADVAEADIVAFCPMSDDIRVYHLKRDPEVDKAVVDACREWWNAHIVADVAPDPDASAACSEVLARMWETEKDRLREASPDERDLIYEAAKAASEAKRAKNRADTLKARLKQRVSDHYGLTIGGKKAVIYYPTKESTYTTTRKAGRTLRLMLEIDG